MYIAQKLKKENVCEYLLYMWQVEDLLRALNLDIDTVNEYVVSLFSVSEGMEHKQLYEWYESLIEMMRMEGVKESGHLQINKNVMIELSDFHQEMLVSNKVPAYNAKFIHVLPFINQLKQKNTSLMSDVEVCFNFMYGLMVLKMKKVEISTQTTQAQVEIGKFLVLLARNFRLYKEGELDLLD